MHSQVKRLGCRVLGFRFWGRGAGVFPPVFPRPFPHAKATAAEVRHNIVEGVTIIRKSIHIWTFVAFSRSLFSRKPTERY